MILGGLALTHHAESWNRCRSRQTCYPRQSPICAFRRRIQALHFRVERVSCFSHGDMDDGIRRLEAQTSNDLFPGDGM